MDNLDNNMNAFINIVSTSFPQLTLGGLKSSNGFFSLLSSLSRRSWLRFLFPEVTYHEGFMYGWMIPQTITWMKQDQALPLAEE